jgi:hypothetical protein
MNLERKFTSSNFDDLHVEIYGDEVHFTINQPYAGSTETGLHLCANITFKKADVLAIAAWLAENCK